ncbi:MAG TPA: alpha/beta hydrolase [Kofleriaceae bacterium]|jgi:alpha-beta hydrolase superfamily lysophospholipase|nr:alpha/beta hydrolase [Polyangiales bacterium]
MTAPGPLAPTKTTEIGGLYAEIFVPAAAPRGVVLICHGYAEHCGRYHEVANVIVQAGWTAISYDVRGHGRSPGPRGYIERFQVYLDDLAAIHAHARTLVPVTAPLVLLGHSHGSLITLRALAGDKPPAAIAAIVSSPFLGLRLAVPRHKLWLAKIGSVLAPKLAQPNALRVEDLTHDKAMQDARTADTLCFDIATARWFTEALAAQNYVEQHASRIAIPTTWLIGGDDPIADPAKSERIARTVPQATIDVFAGFRHEVFNEVERERPFADVTRLLLACSASN